MRQTLPGPGMHGLRISLAAFWVAWLGSPFSIAANEEGIPVDLARVEKCNVPDLAACLSSEGLQFASSEPAPPGASYFYIRYGISTPEAGSYRVSIKGPGSGARGYSRYSLAIDDSPPRAVLLKRRVGTPRAGWQDQGPFDMGPGQHALEFRFYPEQRMRNMNRVTEAFVGHKIRIEGLRLERVPEAAPAPARSDRNFLLHPGDKVVLFGDSITEEGFYARHLARILESAYPQEKIELFNSGVSLNRVCESLERVDLDVLALRPDWVVLAFGVNDAVHLAPEEFGRLYRQLVERLRREKIKVVCATPSGMLPEADRDNNYFHTPDRARAFDRTMAIEAAFVKNIAQSEHLAVADVFGTFTRAGLPRRELMGSQWHPSEEGGRAYALAILEALGFSQEDASRTGDPRDASTFRAITAMPRQELPAPAPRTLPAGPPPGDGQWLVATAFADNAVVGYSRTTGKEVGRVPVAHHPMGVAYSGKRRELYVACEGGGRLDVLRLPEFSPAGSIPLGDVYPVSVVVSEDEASAWVGTFFGASVIQVDLEERKAVRTVPIGALVEGVALTRKGSLVLAAAREKGIVFIDASTGKILSTAQAPKYAASFLSRRDGKVGVIDTAAWTISPIDPAGREVGPPGPAPFESRALAQDPEREDLWASDWKNGKIVRIPAAGSSAIPFAELEFSFGIAAFNVPAGR